MEETISKTVAAQAVLSCTSLDMNQMRGLGANLGLSYEDFNSILLANDAIKTCVYHILFTV